MIEQSKTIDGTSTFKIYPQATTAVIRRHYVRHNLSVSRISEIYKIPSKQVAQTLRDSLTIKDLVYLKKNTGRIPLIKCESMEKMITQRDACILELYESHYDINIKQTAFKSRTSCQIVRKVLTAHNVMIREHKPCIRTERLNKQQLEALMIENNSVAAITKKLQCSRHVVLRDITFHSLCDLLPESDKTTCLLRNKELTNETLQFEYDVQEKTAKEIGDMYGYHEQHILRRLRKLGLKPRTGKDRYKVMIRNKRNSVQTITSSSPV